MANQTINTLYKAKPNFINVIESHIEMCRYSWAGGRVETHLHLTPATQTAPGRGTRELDIGYFLSGWVKCAATSKQWVTAVEDCWCNLLPGVALPLRL